MDELIRRGDLLKPDKNSDRILILGGRNGSGKMLAMMEALMKRKIETAPAVDAVEVVHGWWIPSESDFDDDDVLFDAEEWCDWQCSACHEDICYEDPQERRWLPKFCPNCGAKMDGEA